ncbi:hypothetical protein TIFTF001_030444 [Ficus carica]|uniref:Uncharacterized protein n=1 Tax=Ficus carica TaxID=3494 RepID=A0AA88J459_FICCA|nr:hypothetical protein TIFTF001_030444 [Ficus carica]
MCAKRLSPGLHYLQEATSCTRVAKTELCEIGIAIPGNAWNVQRNAEFNLDEPSGQILVWKVSHESETTHLFQPTHSLDGHTHAVLCLTIGRQMLYSGSMDGMINKWDCGTLQCLATVKGHSSAVTSLTVGGQFLVSGSLDSTIKAWGSTQEGGLEVCHTHKEEKGVLAFGGMNIPVMLNEDNRHDILFCSRDDNSVRLYQLPTFQEKGRLIARQEVQSIQVHDGNRGLFFTGDGTALSLVTMMLNQGSCSHVRLTMWQGIHPCARLSASERACSRTRLPSVRASANVPSHIWFDPARRSYSARSSRPDLLCGNAHAHP